MQLSPATLQELTRLIQQWTGLALGPDKAYLLRHRLAPVVRSCGLGGFDELVLRLQAGGGSSRIQDAVVEAITTKETSFFRDPWLFDALQQLVLPEIAQRAGRKTIRICSAGTSTGQEAYSLAIVVREFLAAHPGDRDDNFRIIALDISGEAIDVAKTGLYSRQEVDRGLTEPRIARFFESLGGSGNAWGARESLRRLIQFRTFNLLRNLAQLGEFELILCRNVLIYFDEPTRARVCRDLCSALGDGGWLAVGSAESLHGTGAPLDSVKFGRAFVYRKPVKSGAGG